jgi:hypothetical protein
MTEDREFRIGDVQGEMAGRGLPRPTTAPAVDASTFPTLAALLKLPPAEFRGRVDALAAYGRQAASADVQGALHAALRVLPEMYKVYGG